LYRYDSVLIHYLVKPAADYVQASVEAALEIHRAVRALRIDSP
jgi:hypothetical protein